MKLFTEKFILYSLLLVFSYTVLKSNFDFSSENEDDLTEEIIKLSESSIGGKIFAVETLNDLMCDSYSTKSLIYLSNDFLHNCKFSYYSEPLKRKLFSPSEIIC